VFYRRTASDVVRLTYMSATTVPLWPPSVSAAPARRGLWTPPAVESIDGRAILGTIERSGGYVRLPDISQQIGWTRTGRQYAIREGLLEAEQVRNARGKPYRLTSDEAATLLLAAMLALAAGVAIAVMLRGVKGAGVTGAAAAAAIRNMPA
jgi:hypothetical protein